MISHSAFHLADKYLIIKVNENANYRVTEKYTEKKNHFKIVTAHSRMIWGNTSLNIHAPESKTQRAD